MTLKSALVMGNVNYAACDEAGWVETISRTLGDSLPLVNVWKQVTAVSCSQLAPDPMGRQRIIVDFAFEVVLLHTAAARVAMSDLWTLRDEARQSMLLALSGEDVSAYWAVESLHALDRLPMLHNRSFAQLMKMVNIPDSLRAVHNVTGVEKITYERSCEGAPSAAPTLAPTPRPTRAPTRAPAPAPSPSPSYAPSARPTTPPSYVPTTPPSYAPSYTPTYGPSYAPSASPSSRPSAPPSFRPSYAPTGGPTRPPSDAPSAAPVYGPTLAPSAAPSRRPSASPSTLAPSYAPSAAPSTVAPSSAAPTTARPTMAPSRVMPFAVATLRSCLIFQKIGATDFASETVREVFARALADSLPEIPVQFQVVKVEAFDVSLADDDDADDATALEHADGTVASASASAPPHAKQGLTRACFEFKQYLRRVRVPIEISYLDQLVNTTQRELIKALDGNNLNANWAMEAIGTDLAERAFANQTYGSLFDMPVPALSLEAIDEFTSIINFEGYATTAPSMSPAPSPARRVVAGGGGDDDDLVDDHVPSAQPTPRVTHGDLGGGGDDDAAPDAEEAAIAASLEGTWETSVDAAEVDAADVTAGAGADASSGARYEIVDADAPPPLEELRARLGRYLDADATEFVADAKAGALRDAVESGGGGSAAQRRGLALSARRYRRPVASAMA